MIALAGLVGLLLGVEHLDEGSLALGELGTLSLQGLGAVDDGIRNGNVRSVLICHDKYLLVVQRLRAVVIARYGVDTKNASLCL